MATDYRKYAENLIGNWNTDQYQPQKDVALQAYNTNWEKLQNDFTKYVDRVKKNLDNSRINYYNELNNADKSSFLRSNSMAENLSSRGLLNSGFASTYADANTSARGTDVNKALGDIVNTNTDYTDKLASLFNSISSGEDKLNSALADTLGGLGDKEQGAKQAYGNLVANLAGAAEAREMENALAAARLGGSGDSKKAQEEADELERRMLIADTLRSEDLSDQEKMRYLSTYLEVPSDIAKQVVEGYSNNKNIEKYSNKVLSLGGVPGNYENYDTNYLVRLNDALQLMLPTKYYPTSLYPKYNALSRLYDDINKLRINKANDKMKGLTYTDLYSLLYGDK